MIDVGEALTRKIGPLPVVAWGAIVGGGILVARALRGGGGGASSNPVIIGAESGSNGGGGSGAGTIGDPDGGDSAVPTVTVPGWSGLLGPPTPIAGGGNAITSYDQPPRPTTIDLRHITAAQRG